MPARKLSSDIQGLLAVFTIGFCMVPTVLAALFAVQSPSWENVGLLPGFLCLGTVALYFARLKRVIAFNDELEVSDLLRGQFIPYQNVSRVRVYDARHVALVTLTLRTPGRFGSNIRFLTNMHLAYAQDQPDVVWLIQRCGFMPQPKSNWWALVAPFFGFRDYA